MPLSKGWTWTIGASIALLAVVALNQPPPDQIKPPSPLEEKKQVQRIELIKESIKLGIFHEVTYGGTNPEAWTDHIFYSLPFDSKQKFVSVIYAYSKVKYPEATIVVRLKDKLTGKEIGKYSELDGGLKIY